MAETTEQIDAELEAWIATRPPHVASVIRKFPPTTCYRIHGDTHGHYRIAAYSEPLDGSPVMIRLLHFPDSFLPGVEVFDVKPETLVRCGCID